MNDHTLKIPGCRLHGGLAGLVVAVFVLYGCDRGAANEDHSQDEAAPLIPVEVQTLRRSDVYAMHSGTASLEAEADAEILAKVGGEVVEILVEEGDRVQAGQTLARLDGERLLLEQKQAQANLRKLEQEYERNIELHEKGLVSAGAFESLKYDLDALRAAYERTRLEFGYTAIRAPFDGIVTERHIKVGNTIGINEATFHLTDFDPLHAYLHVPEREYSKLTAGQSAEIRVDARPETSFRANIARISPVVDPATGTFKVTVEIDNGDALLNPGMFARINIVYDTHANALLVPRSALLDDETATSVFVVEDDLAQRIPIELGLAHEGDIEIIAGLDDDARVVVVGQNGLKEGARVEVINAPN